MTRCHEIIGLMTDELSRTDRQIKDALGYSDMNAIRPRVTELVKLKVLEEICSIKDQVTGKKVRVVRLISNMGN